MSAFLVIVGIIAIFGAGRKQAENIDNMYILDLILGIFFIIAAIGRAAS